MQERETSPDFSNGNMKYAKMKKRKRNSCQPQIPEDLIFNVLKRLPAKSLMRFKIVCKAWHPLICDPYFAESHHAHSQTKPDSSYFLFCVLNEDLPDGVFSSQIPVQIFDKWRPCTNIVNGLICLWDQKRNRIELLNLTTGEKIALPGRKSSSQSPTKYYPPSCFLGFDPSGKQYKVLYFCRRGRDYKIKKCSIITLGSKSWRKIIHEPQLQLVRRTVSVNGAIYWADKIVRNGERFVQYFDVREEKFSLLSVPNEIGNKELQVIKEVGGNLALGLPEDIFNYWEITWWILKNHDQAWIKASINLAGLIRFGRDIRIVGSTRSGEILLKTKRIVDESWDTLIFYNLTTRRKCKTRKITIPKQTNSSAAGDVLSLASLSAVSHHVENILPLKILSEQEKSTEKE